MGRVSAADLVRQARAAARAGETEEAHRLLRQAVALEPNDAQSWLDLAGVVSSPEEKRACFARVLALDPENEEAKAGLAWLERKGEGRGVGDDHADREILYCANHPDTETLLRCNRCNKPICLRCAVRTPVGYRCRECVAEQRALFYTGLVWDYPIAAAVSGLLFALAGFLFFSLFNLGFFGVWIAVLLGPAVGGGVAEAARGAVRRRRSRYLEVVAAASAALGGLVGPALVVSGQGAPLAGLLLAPLFRLDLLLFIGLGAATVYARLR